MDNSTKTQNSLQKLNELMERHRLSLLKEGILDDSYQNNKNITEKTKKTEDDEKIEKKRKNGRG